jgi:hypothetical protein
MTRPRCVASRRRCLFPNLLRCAYFGTGGSTGSVSFRSVNARADGAKVWVVAAPGQDYSAVAVRETPCGDHCDVTTFAFRRDRREPDGERRR